MGVCPECYNNNLLCTYAEDATKCKPCQRQGIYCSGSFDSEEYDQLILQEQRHNHLFVNAMHRLESLLTEFDELGKAMQQCIAAPSLDKPIEPLLRRHDQLDAEMQAAEAAVESNSRRAEDVRKLRMKMMDREQRALEELEPADDDQNEEEDEQCDNNLNDPLSEG